MLWLDGKTGGSREAPWEWPARPSACETGRRRSSGRDALHRVYLALEKLALRLNQFGDPVEALGQAFVVARKEVADSLNLDLGLVERNSTCSDFRDTEHDASPFFVTHKSHN